MSTQSVLFDAPGPKARARNVVYTVCTLILGAVGLAFLYLGFNGTLTERETGLFDPATWAINPTGEWAASNWQPFLWSETWFYYVIPGLQNTLTAALSAAVLALLFGLVFGIGRMSPHWWIRIPAGAVVEFFRGIPLLILIFFTMALPIVAYQVFDIPTGSFQVTALTAVVVGLTLYNGSVLAEVFRAGVLAVPKGQAEAAQAIGMSRSQTMWQILIPQAVTAMMPAIVAQLVILLKDSALGYIVAFPEMLRSFTLVATRESNVIAAAIVCAMIYIAINLSLSRIAIWLERRNSRRGRSSAKPIAGGEALITAKGGPTDPTTGTGVLKTTVQEPLTDTDTISGQNEPGYGSEVPHTEDGKDDGPKGKWD